MKEKKEMKSIEEIKHSFAKDRFATEAAGIEIERAETGYAFCRMKLDAIHRNARNGVMGGAIFTLADFSVAVAANGHKENPDTVTLHAGITFLSPAKGKQLICEATCLKAGRTASLYEAVVTDEVGTQVARASVNCFTVQPINEGK